MQRIAHLSLLFLLACPNTGSASQIQRITLAELQAKADLIVTARITGLVKDGNRDYVTIQVGSYLKGDGPQTTYTFTLTTRGGLKDFDPALRTGDTGVFFLKRKDQKGQIEKAYWGSVAIFQQNHFVLTAEKKGRPADGARKPPAKTSKAHARKPKRVRRPSELDCYLGMNRFILPRPGAILPATTRLITPLVSHLPADERRTQSKKFDELSYLDLGSTSTLATFRKSMERVIERSKELHPIYRAALMFNLMRNAQDVDTWKAAALRAKLECRAATAALKRADEVPLGLVLRILEMSAHARLSFEDGKSPDWPTIRRKRAELWLSSLKRLQTTIDPAWDPKDVPQLNLVPPGGKYPSGIAPAGIREPGIRAAYEALLAKNRRKGERYSIQSTSRKLLGALRPTMASYLVRFYTLGPAREGELKAILKKYTSVVPGGDSILWTTGTIRSILPRGERGKFGLLQAAFAKAGKPAVPKLARLLTDKRTLPFAREEALFGLGMIADPRALPALKRFAGDSHNPRNLRKSARAYIQAIESTDREFRKAKPTSVKRSGTRATVQRVHLKNPPTPWSKARIEEGIQARLTIDDHSIAVLEVRNADRKYRVAHVGLEKLNLQILDAAGKPVEKRRYPIRRLISFPKRGSIPPRCYLGIPLGGVSFGSRQAAFRAIFTAWYHRWILDAGAYTLKGTVEASVRRDHPKLLQPSKKVTLKLAPVEFVVPKKDSAGK